MKISTMLGIDGDKHKDLAQGLVGRKVKTYVSSHGSVIASVVGAHYDRVLDCWQISIKFDDPTVFGEHAMPVFADSVEVIES